MVTPSPYHNLTVPFSMFETDDGKRTITEIVANSVDFLDTKPANYEPQEETPLSDDEVPF